MTPSGPPSWPEGAGIKEGAPTITAPRSEAPEELITTDVTVGDGDVAKPGTVALVDYVGANYSNGTVFDASYGRAPFAVSVGKGMVIPGWDKGLVGMAVGGKRQLVIPPDLAYGAQANGDIPANETLIFIVEMRAVFSEPTPDRAEQPAKLVTQVLREGIGDRAAAKGDQLSLHYVGVHGATGKSFDSSWAEGRPLDLQLGAAQVIKGWDEGLVGMKLGERRRLVIPPDLAYGADGQAPAIGPNETLVFDVDLVGLA